MHANVETTKARSKPVATSSTTPKLLGNWQLQHLVGQGTFTLVYAACPLGCPPSWPADYVMKVVRPEFAHDPITKRLLIREAEVGRQTTHPHLVTLLEAHLDDAQPHLVMPLLQGATLQAAVDRIGKIILPHALWLTRQMAQALHHLHSLGWVHGDVKPANIIVSRHGHATLIDLGSAMRADESLYAHERPLQGSLAYVAPEMLTSTTQTHPSSDIYSLGVTLYQMLSGRLPFTDHDPARLVEAHLSQTAPALHVVQREIPEPVSEFVARMLAKSPWRRPMSGDEVIDALTELEIESLETRFPDSDAA